jgi:hypothetical protein
MIRQPDRTFRYRYKALSHKHTRVRVCMPEGEIINTATATTTTTTTATATIGVIMSNSHHRSSVELWWCCTTNGGQLLVLLWVRRNALVETGQIRVPVHGWEDNALEASSERVLGTLIVWEGLARGTSVLELGQHQALGASNDRARRVAIIDGVGFAAQHGLRQVVNYNRCLIKRAHAHTHTHTHTQREREREGGREGEREGGREEQ